MQNHAPTNLRTAAFGPEAVSRRIECLEPIAQFPMSALAYELPLRNRRDRRRDRRQAANCGP